MRGDENLEVLRQKSRVLERENERLARQVSELLREVLALKKMPPDMVELNLPGLVEQAKGKPPATNGSERQKKKEKGDDNEQKARGRGHGPTSQPTLKVEPELFTVNDADKTCGVCGKTMEEWAGKDDVVDVVHRIPAQWVIKRCTLQKCRCPEGCSIVTAEGPTKLILGGRYSLDVAIFSCIEKFLFHIPTERQVRQAALSGMRITSQALWDQQWALTMLLAPLVGKIKAHILSGEWLGADLTPFLHIKKGGSTKQQVWQLACPDARYFEMLDTKRAAIGAQVFSVAAPEGNATLTFKGTAVVDGAAELQSLATALGFRVANCWSHARRNVLAAMREAPGQVAQFLEIVAKLYAIEREAAGVSDDVPLGGYRKLLDLDRLRAVRDKESRAVVDELRVWMLAQQCIPGGSLKKGLAYVAARWSALTVFLDDPRVPLDNNVSEAGFVVSFR
jgi:transposase